MNLNGNRVANFQKMKFGTRCQSHRDRDAMASRGWGMGREYPPPQPTKGSGGASARPKRIWGILSVAERLGLKEHIRDTFVTAYTSAQTITGHQLAKTAPVHYSVNSGTKIKGEKPEIRIIVHITFSSVKIRDISLSRTELFRTVGNPKVQGKIDKLV